MRRRAVLLALAFGTATGWAQQAHQSRPAKHVITDAELDVLHDCHKITIAADEALDQARSEASDGRARLEKPDHGTAYDCYTEEKPAYKVLLELYVKDRISDEDLKLMHIVEEDMAYFELSLTKDEK